MTLSNQALVEAFVQGDKHGQSNRMTIQQGPISYGGSEHVHEGETAIVAYGWAIYAKRTTSGRVVLFNGWYNWAKEKPGHSGQTTIQHMSLIDQISGDNAMSSVRRPQCADTPYTAKTMRPEYR